jgi:pre-mRNA-splicing factor ISY1
MSQNQDRSANYGNEISTGAIIRFQEVMKTEKGLRWDASSDKPFTPENATTVAICEQARRMIVKEINIKLGKIYDQNLEEYQIRAINDEINELVKVKKAWDFRVRQLGGFKIRVNERYEDVGTEGAIYEGYYYFGRAKELPEYKNREIKEKSFDLEIKEQEQADTLLTRLQCKVDAEYFGYQMPHHDSDFEDDEIEDPDYNPEESLTDYEERILGPQIKIESIETSFGHPSNEEIMTMLEEMRAKRMKDGGEKTQRE